MDAVTWIVSLQGPALLFALVMGLTWLLGQLPLLKVVTGYRILAAVAIGTALGPFVLGPWPLGWETAFVALGQGFLIALAAGGGKSLLGAVPKILEQMSNPRGEPGGRALLLFVPLLVLAGGCMAPAAVREGQAAEAKAFAGYVNNVGRINDLTLSMYEVERTAAVKAATADAMRKVNAAAVDGKLPVADFAGSLEALVGEREKAAAQTASVVAKVRKLIAANNQELGKALRLQGAISDWLDAGIDQSVIPGLIDEAMTIFRAFQKPAAATP
jgi:hypothetical protein